MTLAEFDFFDDTPEDSTGTPNDDHQEPELVAEESTAEDATDEGAQEEPTDESQDEVIEDEEEEQEVVEIDGKFVTLDEIRELQKGGLREKDYTKKTQ